ncbi:SCO3374 family protein [Streptomyces sp. NPDC006458]|uniref:SCO3374 family protein n=1 Tax=Streptomyces sp. NPDC006458 TaxID=3154302 RepID=UPI00339EF73D
MVGAHPPVTPVPPASPALPCASPTVPLPRRGRRATGANARIRRWYENELGWATVPGDPVRLPVGLRFDVLDVPAAAGLAALRHLRAGSPVAVYGDRMWLLTAAGSAEELPAVLAWLEWGALATDLVPIGAGATIRAPRPPRPDATMPGPADEPFTSDRRVGGPAGSPAAAGHRTPGPTTGSPVRTGSLQGAAWLRPPVPGYEVEASLPTLSALGGVRDAPDLVRVVDTVATQCHRIRLRRKGAQPPVMP